jgi:dTMP kinase
MAHLAEWLPASGLMPSTARLIQTREPGGTALGQALRELLLHPPEAAEPEPVAELLLYAADRAQHVAQVIRPALARGDWVLTDRFTGSTMAYQGFGRQLDQALIHQLALIATGGLTPDLTVWLSLPVAVGVARRGGRRADRIEAAGLAFLQRVADGFAAQAAAHGWLEVRADRPLAQVCEAVELLLRQQSRSWSRA